VDQWPLTGEKLAAGQALIQEQLQAGHIEISHSPWNMPIFVIKKKIRQMVFATGFKSYQ
jgi:hypothetical protein